jgi:DNA sulfur modification protein DndB
MMWENGIKTIIRGKGYDQFGKRILVSTMSYSLLEAIFEVDSMVQRKLDPKRRLEIREFIIKAVQEEDFYFSPFIFSARGQIKETANGWELDPGCKLYILDGQHRSAALSDISTLKGRKETAEELEAYDEAHKLQTYIDKLKSYPVSMQIYLDLDQQQERQLFTDINTERREPHKGLIMQYEQRDEYTLLTRQVAKSLENSLEIEQTLSRITKQSSSITSLTIMRRCLIAMFEGIITVKTGDPYFKNCKPEQVPMIAEAFFKSWQSIFPKNMANRNIHFGFIRNPNCISIHGLLTNQNTIHYPSRSDSKTIPTKKAMYMDT